MDFLSLADNNHKMRRSRIWQMMIPIWILNNVEILYDNLQVLQLFKIIRWFFELAVISINWYSFHTRNRVYLRFEAMIKRLIIVQYRYFTNHSQTMICTHSLYQSSPLYSISTPGSTNPHPAVELKLKSVDVSNNTQVLECVKTDHFPWLFCGEIGFDLCGLLL